MITSEEHIVDKSTWGPGPWLQEPDKKQWRDASTGLACLAVRQESLGHWCGYVGVPAGHPAYKQDYDSLDLRVHGGLTYAHQCSGAIRHKPEPGQPDDVWWLGFDCAHCDDSSPGMEALSREQGWSQGSGVYRELGYVEQQCASLAQQLKELEERTL